MNNSHNIENEKNAHPEVQERNKKILTAYNNIVSTINRMQGIIEHDFLRLRIESEMVRDPNNKTTILQCATPWCIVSLGCDSLGRYNIVYSVDYRIQEMIGQDMASGIIRRIYEYTPGEMEPFVRIGNLNLDSVNIFHKLLEEQEKNEIHRLIQQ